MESIVGFANGDDTVPPLDIFSDVFDIVIVWFGVSASAGTGRAIFLRTSAVAGRAPMAVSTCRLLLLFPNSSSSFWSSCLSASVNSSHRSKDDDACIDDDGERSRVSISLSSKRDDDDDERKSAIDSSLFLLPLLLCATNAIRRGLNDDEDDENDEDEEEGEQLVCIEERMSGNARVRVRIVYIYVRARARKVVRGFVDKINKKNQLCIVSTRDPTPRGGRDGTTSTTQSDAK